MLEERGQARLATRLAGSPERIFEHAYLPLDQRLAKRLGWLISQYLLNEDSPPPKA